MNTVADSVPRNANDIKKRIAKQILRSVVRATPVDTSQAKSRWQVGINTAPTGTFGPHYPGKHGSTSSQSTAVSIALGEAIIDRAQVSQSIFVGNNVPYIRRLNNGYSKQAPANFVQIAARQGIIVLAGLKVIR